MHCHCGTNNIAPRWTFKDPCKPEVRPGVREESASPTWLVEPAMNARDITKGIYGGLTLDVDRHYIGSVTATTHQGPHAVRVSQDTNPDCPIHSPARKPLSQPGGRNLFKMTTIGEGLSAIICKMLPEFKYITKSTNSCVQQSLFMLLYALFILFPVRLADNFRFDGRYCIGDLMTHAMIRNFLYSEFDR